MGCEKYKWVDVTDDIEKREVNPMNTEGLGLQCHHEGRVVFTLIPTPVGSCRLSPARPLVQGDYRVMIDYSTDPECGIGAIWHRVPSVEWVDVTRECKPVIKESMHTTGHYGVLIHMGQQIALLGIDGVKLCSGMGEKYKIEKPKNARVSFSVLKKATC